jgi:hypothetical protein
MEKYPHDSSNPIADARKAWATVNTQSPSHSIEPIVVEKPTGWKYKSLKLGPITLPWYASPETQLIVVSFVCFLCPGKVAQHNIFLRATDLKKACSMLSTALVVEVRLSLMLVTPRTLRSTLLSRLSVSSPAPSLTPSASELHFHSAALDTVFTSAHICATTILRTLVMLSSPAFSLDAVQAFSGPRRAQL